MLSELYYFLFIYFIRGLQFCQPCYEICKFKTLICEIWKCYEINKHGHSNNIIYSICHLLGVILRSVFVVVVDVVDVVDVVVVIYLFFCNGMNILHGCAKNVRCS